MHLWFIQRVMMQIVYRKILLCLLGVLLFTCQHLLMGQNVNGEVWGAYINTIQLNNQWKIWNDYHYVTRGFYVIRPGLTYETNNGFQIGAGYAYVRASTVNTERLRRQESRIWGQVIKRFRSQHKLQYIIRVRYDARFRASLDARGDIIANHYTFNNRFRLMQNFRYRLSPRGKLNFWRADFINETLINSGKQIQNGIDQIRNYVMIGYTTSHLTVLSGYHQRFIQSKPERWTLNHGFAIWLIYDIDLRKKAQ